MNNLMNIWIPTECKNTVNHKYNKFEYLLDLYSTIPDINAKPLLF